MGNVASIGFKLQWVVLQLLANMTAQSGHSETRARQGDPYRM